MGNRHVSTYYLSLESPFFKATSLCVMWLHPQVSLNYSLTSLKLSCKRSLKIWTWFKNRITLCRSTDLFYSNLILYGFNLINIKKINNKIEVFILCQLWLSPFFLRTNNIFSCKIMLIKSTWNKSCALLSLVMLFPLETYLL